jgi:hypothetical protein
MYNHLFKTLLNSLHEFTAHIFSESQKKNLQDRIKYFVPSGISDDTFPDIATSTNSFF